jgi:hypothetical protein
VVFKRFADGKLKKLKAIPTGGKGSTQSVGCGPGCPILDSQNAVVVSKSGLFIFAVNAGSDTVTSFRWTASGLKRVSVAPTGGDMPESLALGGSYLYVLNVATENVNGTTGNITRVAVAADGRLNPDLTLKRFLANAAPPDHSADPRAIEISRDGKVLVATEIAGGFMGPGPPGRIDTFVVGPSGTLAPAVSHPSADPFPFGFAFGNNGQMVVSNIRDPTNPTTIGSVSSYSVTGVGGVTPIQTKSSAGILPCWVVITGDGKYVFVVNTGAGHPAPISRFRMSANGKLTRLTPSARSRPGEFARTDAALSRDSKFLYVLAPKVGPGNASHIDEYRVGAKGGLRFIGSTPGGANLGIGATGLAAR